MALTVSTAPKYSGTLKVGTAAPTGNLSVGTNTGMQGSTYNPQQTINGSQLQGGSGTSVLGATSVNNGAGGYVPTAAEIAQANAERAEAARINGVRNSAAVKRGGIESGAQTSLTDNRNTFQNDSQGFVNGIRQGQNTINTGRVNNALNLRRSMAAIASGVRQGMRSGGVDLANMNALDSGAADALARAWARAGGQQSGAANNEAQLKENEIATQQTNLDLQETQGLGKLKQWRDTETSRVSNKLWNDLQALEADSAAQGAGGVVDLSVRDRMINAAAAELDAIDRATNAALGEIRGLSQAEIAQQAFQMEQAGTEVANPFAVEAVGAGFQGNGNGAAIGQFNTRPRFRDEQSPVYNPFRPDERQAVA